MRTPWSFCVVEDNNSVNNTSIIGPPNFTMVSKMKKKFAIKTKLGGLISMNIKEY